MPATTPARARGFWRDTRGAAAAFSSISLLAVVLCIGYCINLADVTHAKMRAQDAADAAAYSGGRVRGNLYAMMGFLNMGKVALYRRNVGYPLTNGQAMLLAQMDRVTGVSVNPLIYSPDPLASVADVQKATRDYAEIADRMQLYIANRFSDLIGNEVTWNSKQNGGELVESYPGRSPVFALEWVPERFWGHLIELDRWVDWEYWSCNIMRSVRDPDVDVTSSPLYDLDPANPWFPLLNPGYPWQPRVISHAFDFQQNSIKVVLEYPAPEGLVLPGVLQNLNPKISCTAAAGCFSPEMGGTTSYPNLYTTDFRGQLLNLDLTGFREWLAVTDSELESKMPWDVIDH